MSLDIESLYYQDMITNNYTSNMLNGIMGISSGTGSGLLSDAVGGISSPSFASILSQYLQTDTKQVQEAATWADTLSGVLEEVEASGDHSKSTATVQQLYEYFREKMTAESGIFNTLGSGLASTGLMAAASSSSASVKETTNAVNSIQMPEINTGIINEEAIEAEIESSIAAALAL